MDHLVEDTSSSAPPCRPCLLRALVRNAPGAEQAVAPRAAGPALRLHSRAHDAGVCMSPLTRDPTLDMHSYGTERLVSVG